MEGFAEKDFVICVWIEVTYVDGRSDQSLKVEMIQPTRVLKQVTNRPHR